MVCVKPPLLSTEQEPWTDTSLTGDVQTTSARRIFVIKLPCKWQMTYVPKVVMTYKHDGVESRTPKPGHENQKTGFVVRFIGVVELNYVGCRYDLSTSG
jgi:hypothetical protein